MAMNKCSTILLVFYTTVAAANVAAKLQRFDHHPMKADGSLDILVVGDWGRRGLYNQSNVAHEMGKVGQELDADFIISTGDNFYDDGLTDEDDPLFLESFTHIYTSTSLQKQWYSVFGNHDYRGNVLAQLSHALTQRDSKWLCLRSFIVNSGNVEFFFVDTTPFQDKYFTEEKHKYDWRGVLPREEYISNVLEGTRAMRRRVPWNNISQHVTVMEYRLRAEMVECRMLWRPHAKVSKASLVKAI